MTEPRTKKESPPGEAIPAQEPTDLARANPLPEIEAKPATPKELSADEQMALYEKEMKENDWGHQPC